MAQTVYLVADVVNHGLKCSISLHSAAKRVRRQNLIDVCDHPGNAAALKNWRVETAISLLFPVTAIFVVLGYSRSPWTDRVDKSIITSERKTASQWRHFIQELTMIRNSPCEDWESKNPDELGVVGLRFCQ